MNIIEIKQLTKIYKLFEKEAGFRGSLKSLFNRRYTEKKAVSEFDLTVEKGEFIGLIGRNGAGKTTLIKAICEELGVEDQASSPTFSIVNEYATTRGPVFHFDFYRIKSEQEAMDLGYEEYFYSGHPCFVEWPELIPSLIPDNAIAITIRLLPNGIRELSVAAPKA